jgi:hypothetical protein
MDQTIKAGKGQQISAQIISFLLHPVFLPVLSFLLLYHTGPENFATKNPRVQAQWFSMIVINTVVFPLVLILLLKGLGFIKSIHMKEQRDRVIPLIGIMVFYFWAYLVAKNGALVTKAYHMGFYWVDLVNLKLNLLLGRAYLLGFFWGIVAVFMISIFFKISMHTSGAGSFLAVVTILMIATKSFLLLPLVLGLVAAVLIGWGRSTLQAHTRAELWSGYLVGFFVQMAAYVYVIW